MITRVRLLCIFAAVLALLALPAFAADDSGPGPDVRVVRLSLAQGDVQIDRGVGVGWEQAINNMPIPSGTRVYAAEDSKAEVQLEDGSTIRLAGPAQVGLDELSLTADGSLVNDIEIDSGLVYINAALTAHADFRIQDANGTTFVITEPSELRFKVDEQVASLAVMDGEVEALDATGYTLIRTGQSYNYILGQPESAVLVDKIVPENEDSWNEQRNQYQQQYAQAEAEYSGGENPYEYGAADLGYYGSYEDIPGYGESWQPYDVGPDWSPFDYGAWCYYPDWGWTFVSGYPWGWEPFYFGDWFYVSGRGWWWHRDHDRDFDRDRLRGRDRLGDRDRLHHGPERGRPFRRGGFHPRPQLAQGTDPAAHGVSLPRPPSSSSHRTVAVAGSNLRVGPIGVTHPSLPGSSALPGGSAFAGPSSTGARARPGSISNLARPGASTLPRSGTSFSPARPGARFSPARPGARSNPARPGASGFARPGAMSSPARPGAMSSRVTPRSFITGRPGSYVVHGPAARTQGMNGYELNRPGGEFNRPPAGGFRAAPPAYSHSAPRPYGGHVYTGHVYSPAPRSFSTAPVERTAPAPVERAAPMMRAPAAPPPMSFAPHVSSGFSGGGFHGGSIGAVGGFHGGAIGGGGFHGGGIGGGFHGGAIGGGARR